MASTPNSFSAAGLKTFDVAFFVHRDQRVQQVFRNIVTEFAFPHQFLAQLMSFGDIDGHFYDVLEMLAAVFQRERRDDVMRGFSLFL